MKTPEAMKGRKLLIRLHEPGIKPLRPDGLYMATAEVTKYYISNKWVDLEYVIPDKQGDLEPGKLHLDREIDRKGCIPEAFAGNKRTKKRGGVHCGWAMYKKDVTGIGEDSNELLETAQAAR